MEIYTLVGRSGTGKSFHAMNLCKKLDIEAIIDDGLFIYKNSVIAGISAKRASTKIGAVKVALFNDDSIRRQVTDAIQLKKPASILILGTSDGMVNKIIQRLGLPELAPDSLRRIKIEDITTEEERRTAHDQRENLGKHVIPAPSMPSHTSRRQCLPTFPPAAALSCSERACAKWVWRNRPLSACCRRCFLPCLFQQIGRAHV